jgi:hypothetical protein
MFHLLLLIYLMIGATDNTNAMLANRQARGASAC